MSAEEAVADDPLGAAVCDARERYAARRPRTRLLHERARKVMPGGNTRTTLYHRPFPIRVDEARDAVLTDVDGHDYVDLLGDYSAALYGHSHPVIVRAMTEALGRGLGRGTHTPYEVDLAEAVTDRFTSIEQVRFTNSGTEANLMALAAVRAYTGRDRILVFEGGYHGGTLTFSSPSSPVNAPYEFVVAPYNDADEAVRVLRENAGSIAAVLVEPMLGASGCIPGDPAFLRTLRDTTRETGALLVLDEVMTSRTGAGGLQERLAIAPDLTTLGKYLGGGASFGAFGGSAEVMGVFDPTRAGGLPHGGTFNNNSLSMSAGRAGLVDVYTPRRADEHTARGDRLRADLNDVLDAAGVRFQVTGVGSLMAFHPTRQPVRRPSDLRGADPRPLELLFLDLLEEGYYIAARGYLALSLAVTDGQLEGFLRAVERVVRHRGALYATAG